MIKPVGEKDCVICKALSEQASYVEVFVAGAKRARSGDSTLCVPHLRMVAEQEAKER